MNKSFIYSLILYSSIIIFLIIFSTMYHNLPKPYCSTPTHNYFSGDVKSTVWSSPQYYVPSERNWITYHGYRHLPSTTKRDAIDFQSEDDWVSFMRKRDTPIGIMFFINSHT